MKAPGVGGVFLGVELEGSGPYLEKPCAQAHGGTRKPRSVPVWWCAQGPARWLPTTTHAFHQPPLCPAPAPSLSNGFAYVLRRAQLCIPMDCSMLGSAVHGIYQARILEWVAISSSRGSSWPRDWPRISFLSWISRWILYHWATWEAQL